MQQLPLSLQDPAADLALDEALLSTAVARELPKPVLRIWESSDYAVILGRSSNARQEVNQAACRWDGVHVLRRCSGGATVVIGPGCLMYSLILESAQFGGPPNVTSVHRLILQTHVEALRKSVPGIARAGTSDLAFPSPNGDNLQKCSGNSLRIGRTYLLYHGTLLYDFDVDSISRWLNAPTRQPEYRADRSHSDFVANMSVSRQALVDLIITAWQADSLLEDWPEELTRRIAADITPIHLGDD